MALELRGKHVVDVMSDALSQTAFGTAPTRRTGGANNKDLHPWRRNEFGMGGYQVLDGRDAYRPPRFDCTCEYCTAVGPKLEGAEVMAGVMA
eukprot:SAG11_NODE_7413_length_1148_cov_0.930410_1_plen_91_part_10